MEMKIFNDFIHGHMLFHPLIAVIIDTRQVQRLRNIKQLGCCYFVYPTASHNRFEHCLGTAHIAGKLFEYLKVKADVKSEEEEKTWEKNKLNAQIAGLCHDIGHGPFSHTWEKFRRRLNPDDDWKHEVESIRIFDDILEENISPQKNINGNLKTVRDAFSYYGLNSEDIETIKKMILGQKDTKNYLFQVVNNKNNGIDVDKWDYLARDSVMLNVPITFDYRRLLTYCQVLRNENGEKEICYRNKECSTLVEMFLARGRLHDKAYQHEKVVIIEHMLIDALALANDRMKLTDTPITQLTDHIFQKILYDDFGDDESMRKAREILRRIESRHLYKCFFRESFKNKIPDIKLIKNKLKSVQIWNRYLDDIVIATVKLDMTKANKDQPLKNVMVYKKNEDKKISCMKFDWQKYENSLKPNMEHLQRYQFLVLYKGKELLSESLTRDLRNHFQKVIMEVTCNKTNNQDFSHML